MRTPRLERRKLLDSYVSKVVISDRRAVLNLREPLLSLSKLAIAASSGVAPKRWYPLIKDFRTAIRAFLASSPLPIRGLQPDLAPKKS